MLESKPRVIRIFLVPLVTLIAIAVNIGLLFVQAVMFANDVTIVDKFLINLGAIFIAICCYYFLNKLLLRNALESLLDRHRLPSQKQLFQWIAISVLIVAVVILAYFCAGGVSVISVGSSVFLGFLAALAYSIFPGVIEELSYRYFMYGYFRTVIPRIWAVLFSGIIFGSLHLNKVSSAIEGLQLLVSAICVTVLFCTIYEATGSIWTSAVLHVIWDISTQPEGLFLANLQNHEQKVSYGQIEITVLSDNTFLSGAGFGIELGVLTMLVYLFSALVIWRFRSKLLIKSNSGVATI